MKLIEKEEIKRLLDSKTHFALVNALRPADHAKVHIPNSINLPIRLDGFDELAGELIPDKERKSSYTALARAEHRRQMQQFSCRNWVTPMFRNMLVV
ncbi:MAG: rhodanese-like domain-containing protein [Candidatus Cloacimonetes bacterium]|nr:rhodanese-like domain-containing protein [Candidatus Cloacimonadota bacterium]MCF7814728.1 rhodanese-like domain-containing protein [Candidatus Cloacimonadota bacterium]MCF7869131.1 rhodanese-like domain-containing protein [Candidatus Cloacimonadota bacterium]MCF7884600.1 rhodanese-like domain-containing protein [Candidatus Cloacimonadota bacterium]